MKRLSHALYTAILTRVETPPNKKNSYKNHENEAIQIYCCIMQLSLIIVPST